MRSLVPPGTELTHGELFTLAVTYFSVGVAGTVILAAAGTPPLVILAAAFLVNSITTPLAFIAVLEAGGSTWSALLAGWLVASRFGVLAASISPRLWAQRWKRAVAAFGTFDPNVALALREKRDESVRRVFVVQTLGLEIPWYIGTVLALLVGDRLGDPRTLGLDAVLPAALLAIVWPQLRTRVGAIVAGGATMIALGLLEFTPGGVPALVAGLAAFLSLSDASQDGSARSNP